MPQKNDIYTVEITDINNFGYGVARIDGIVTFATGAVTGDIAKVRIIKTTKNYLVAKVEELITPSSVRSESPCPVSGKCGGCIYSGITYEHELILKKKYVINAFKKAGVEISVDDVVSSGETSGYRNKLQYPVSRDFSLGYYAGKTHKIIPYDKCPLQSDVMNRLAHAAADLLREFGADAYDEETKQGLVRHIYVRHAETTGELMLTLVINGEDIPRREDFIARIRKRFPTITGILLNINRKDTNVILGERYILMFGRDYICDEMCGLTFRVTPQSFYQINRRTAEMIYRDAAEKAELHEGEHLVDLFCGTGTIGLCIIKNVPNAKLTGIEIVSSAIECAKQNAELNHIENAQFICGDANAPELASADIVVLDPPRKGCDSDLIEKICRLSPKRIVYISCDANTLARDVKLFIGHGYCPGNVTPYDMFPRTGHIENIVLLKR